MSKAMFEELGDILLSLRQWRQSNLPTHRLNIQRA
jgi:hypothetical protein